MTSDHGKSSQLVPLLCLYFQTGERTMTMRKRITLRQSIHFAARLRRATRNKPRNCRAQDLLSRLRLFLFMAHGFSQALIAEAIRNADPAAQISDGLVVHLAAELQPLFSTRVAAYGRETCAQELLPLPRSCSACKTRLAECRGSATPAAVIDLCGVVEKLHVPLRCRKPSCPEFGVLLWYNYCVRKGKHVFQGELPLLQCFMLSSSFGFSIPWLRQFHLRLVRQHASFTSEADVLTAQAATNSQLHRLPTSRLRLLISQGWFTWRLLTRGLEAGLDLSVVDFQSPMEDTACRFLGPLQAAFSRKAVEGAQRAKMRCDVIVLDGNAKNRRAVCAAALAGCSYSPTLRRTLRHTCTKTPAFKHCFCLHHCEAPGADRSHTVSWLESSNIFSFVCLLLPWATFLN